MSGFSFEVESGKTVKLATAGKYCNQDILVTAIGGDTETAYQQGVADGKEEHKARFWYMYQQAGERRNYEGAFFGVGWSDYLFSPQYDIVATGSINSMFRRNSITDLAGILERNGVVLNTASANNVQYTFYLSGVTHIPALDFSGVANASVFTQCFASCSDLVTIDKIKLATISGTFSGVFDSTPMLENITFEGEINRNGLSFKTSTKLTHDSLLNILNALADYADDTSGTSWVLTLGTANLAKLTDLEKAIATEKGWTLV